MLELVGKAVNTVALTLAVIALAWLVIDLLFAEPAELILMEVAIICAALAPVICLIGWGIRWIGLRRA